MNAIILVQYSNCALAQSHRDKDDNNENNDNDDNDDSSTITGEQLEPGLNGHTGGQHSGLQPPGQSQDRPKDQRVSAFPHFLISLFPHHCAFPHFLISSSSCLSSFPYSLIIVLFPPQHRINSSLSQSFLLRVQTFISSFIPALFSKSLLNQQTSLSLFMVFEMNSSSNLF